MNMRKKSQKEIEADKANRIMEGIAYWGSFYRSNPQRFVKDYLNINLKLFQKILIYAMMHNERFMYIASRGQGKTWLTALFCTVRCILFPKTKICVASGTKGQALQVLLKITEDFMKGYGWGSDNLRREILEWSTSVNNAVITFKNGSWIKVVTASDGARGNRANIVIIDEFRIVDKDIIDNVLLKFLSSPRHPNYLDNPKYKHLEEENKRIFMSSAWFQDHWGYRQCQDYGLAMLDENKKYFICGLPYQISIKESLLSRGQVQDDMTESTFNDVSWLMEMDALWYGDSEGAFFSYDDVSSRRKLKSAIYPTYMIDKKNYKIPDLLDNERRILSVDIALMASGKHKNDASALIINRAIPTNRDNYVANIVYMENHEGLHTDELALIIRKLYRDYKCTDIVLDCSGQGLGVFDALVRDQVDPETGELYEALSCYNDKDMAARCKVDNAPKVIWSIKASASFNSEMCVSLRGGFKEKRINLLISELDADNILKKEVSGYGKMSVEDQVKFKMPYLNTTLLVNELTKLEHESKGGKNIKIKEKSGMRKDRYSSLGYNYWVQCQLERELLHAPKNNFTMEDYIKGFKKLNKKPISY